MSATLRRVSVVCSHCGAQHIDKGEWAMKNHTRHLCEACHRFFYTKPGNVGVAFRADGLAVVCPMCKKSPDTHPRCPKCSNIVLHSQFGGDQWVCRNCPWSSY